MKEEKRMLYREDPQRRQMGFHVSREHLRFMDQHLMGSGYYPSLLLSIPRKKKRLYSPWRRVGGYDCSHVFDGDGIHSLANTENKIPEIPKPPVCDCAGGSCMWFTGGWWHESFMWGKIWNKHLASWGQNLVTWVTRITRALQEGYDFTYFQKCAHLQVNFSFGLSSCETVELLHMWSDECG